MTKSKALEALRRQETRDDLFPVQDILYGYEIVRKKANLPDDHKVSLRAFRFWMNKGLFYTPLHGKFNKALYPAKTIDEIAAVRWLQFDFNLTLAQIKDIFLGLPVGYFDGIVGLQKKSKINEFRQLLTEYSTRSVSKVKQLILSCSNYEAKKKETFDYLGVRAEDEFREMMDDFARPLGKTFVYGEKGKQLVEYQEHLKREYCANLKKISAIFRAFNEERVRQYLKRKGDHLFKESMNIHLKLEDPDISPVNKFEAQLKVDLLGVIGRIKNKKLSVSEGLRLFNELKRVSYRLAALNTKKQRAEAFHKESIILEHDLRIEGKNSLREEIFQRYPYTIIAIHYEDESVVAVTCSDEGLIDKKIIPKAWYSQNHFFKKYGKEYDRAIMKKWFPGTSEGGGPKKT